MNRVYNTSIDSIESFVVIFVVYECYTSSTTKVEVGKDCLFSRYTIKNSVGYWIGVINEFKNEASRFNI